ncbi:TetR/AcrR family transcriptional regulator [Kribbella sancticallisti]|uniref:TetR/AcrR family transcriptional regulator n=1 Tax=Kribbella sancticallisti TaxID=460087 RepID=A0ABN2EXP3_9ACTN
MAAATSGKRRHGPRKGDLREKAILDAAEELLGRDGIELMTVESIANRAGISRAALYFYFGSKLDVLTALVKRTVDAMAEQADVAQAAESSADDVITASVRHTADLWREHGLVLRAAVDLASGAPEIRGLWTGTVTRYAAAMTEVLSRASRPDPAMAEALCWMTERTFYWASVNGDDLDRTAETCAQIWCATIRGTTDV